jgi:hypothetical protein
MKHAILLALFFLVVAVALPNTVVGADLTSATKSVGDQPTPKQSADEVDEADDLGDLQEVDDSSSEASALEKPSDERKTTEAKGAKPGHSKAVLYTACNLWYERANGISSINYKRGIRIPAGTPVQDVRIDVGSAGSQRGKAVIRFVRKKDGASFAIVFEPRYHPKETVEDFKMRIFTTKDFESLTKGFTDTEMRAIRAGKLKIGMRRAAVLVAWGPPPEHKTPSLDANVWTYWLSRVPNWIKKVHFDSNGKTVRPPEETREPDDL